MKIGRGTEVQHAQRQATAIKRIAEAAVRDFRSGFLQEQCESAVVPDADGGLHSVTVCKVGFVGYDVVILSAPIHLLSVSGRRRVWTRVLGTIGHCDPDRLLLIEHEGVAGTRLTGRMKHTIALSEIKADRGLAAAAVFQVLAPGQ